MLLYNKLYFTKNNTKGASMKDNNRAQEELLLPSKTPGQHNKPETKDRLALFSERVLDRADTLIYSLVGLLFLVGAFFALGYSIWNFVVSMQDAISKAAMSDVAPAIISFVSDLLLVLIIMEVLSTVIQYLKAHATSLRPFLFIGIISAVRSILSVGAKLSVGAVAAKNGNDFEFTNAMIELGVSAAVVLALGITLKLLGKMVDIDSSGD